MKKTRRTETTVEIHEFYAIRTASGSLPALCAECSQGDAIMVHIPAMQSHVLPPRLLSDRKREFMSVSWQMPDSVECRC